MPSDRRKAPRKPGTVAVEIDSKVRKHRVGVSRDASETGMLMATPSRFEIGDELELTLFLAGSEKVHVRAKVMRLEQTAPGSGEMWRYRLAVTFLEPVADLTARVS